jgi:hypothetical protein
MKKTIATTTKIPWFKDKGRKTIFDGRMHIIGNL